jgi:hypothetical protein
MGFSPQQVDAMSLWQFTAASDGHRRSTGDESTNAPSDERYLSWLTGKG